MNHRSVFAAVLGVGFILGTAAPVVADPGWGHRRYEARGHEFRGHERWRHERWEHHRPHYGYGHGYQPRPYFAPPVAYFGLPGLGIQIR